MNFSLLGDDADVLPLIRAIAAHNDHRLAHVCGADAILSKILSLDASVRVTPDWQEFATEAMGDVVIVTGHDSGMFEAAKQLAASGSPLVVFPRYVPGATWIYELTLTQDEFGTFLYPVFPLRLHPQVQAVRNRIAGDEFGRVRDVEIGREILAKEGQGPSRLLSINEIDHALLHDVDVLRFLSGDYDQVTALYSGTVADGVSSATVTVVGDRLPQSTWTAKPTRSESSWTLRVTGEAGSVSLGKSDIAENAAAGNSFEKLAENPDLGEAILAHVELGIAGEQIRPDWLDMTRACEIVEATHRSVRRRRTIDLHFESTSERSQFKTQMTAIGCMLLIATFFAVLLLLMAGTLFDLPPLVAKIARIVVFLPLMAFLALQVLMFLSRPSRADSDEPDGEKLGSGEEAEAS